MWEYNENIELKNYLQFFWGLLLFQIHKTGDNFLRKYGVYIITAIIRVTKWLQGENTMLKITIKDVN